MNGKIRFAVDYLNVMFEMNARARQGIDPTAYAATLMFLVEWGLTTEEINSANNIFWEQIDRQTLEELRVVVPRITQALKDREDDKKRLLTQLAAIADFDSDITEDEANYLRSFGELLDLRPSEINALFERGSHLAFGLRYFGSQYMANNKPKQSVIRPLK